ncbi:unnamed protein product [Polarella glacialis]|uniref:EGF-like domain-containing protein n=2 Tax=Polarella glacialis TaxID=89957 RepID=A0A813KRC8_POLGL|nr:unnamed protein product [Polarella glacialis]
MQMSPPWQETGFLWQGMRKREHQLRNYCDLQVLLLLLLVSFLLRGALADEVPEAASEKARSLQGGLNVDGIKVLDVGATSFPAQVSEASCCQPLSNAAPARELHLVAGLRYQLSLWSAAGDLATPASAVRLRLVTGGPANDHSACATGGSRVVTNFGGANSSLNGLGPADAASAVENMWSEARVPFNGSFGLCYLADASLQPEAWLAVRNVTLVAFGAPEAAARHFCLAEVNASCSLQVGLPSAGARLMLIQPGYTCGLPGGRWFEPPFERNISTPLLPGANNSNLVTLHRFGLALPEALEASGSSFRVCVCDTFEYDTASDGIGSCRSAESEDFPQSLGGLLHLVLASALPSNVFQATPFSIEVRCGAAAISGGCAGTTAARIRLVDPAPAGGWGDAGTSSDFCRFASQSNLYDGPSNCDLGGGSGQGSSPPTCHWPPSSASTSLPAWAGVVLRPRLLANVAVPVELGICYCDGSAGCSGDTWFRGGRVTAEPLRFQPQQLIAGVLVNLSLVAPGFSNGSSAGFLATDAAHMLKLIYDPNATLVEGSCATAVPTSDSISNLGCTTPATCRPPSSTSAEVLTWESVGAQLPGLYAACYCQAVNSTTGCEVASGAQGAGGWQLLGWQLAAGVTGVYAGSWLQGTVLYAGSRFELTVLGVGLSNDDRLYFLPGEVACDTTSVQQAVASPQGNSGIAAPAAYSEPLLPRSSAAGEVLAIVRQGLFRIRLVLASAHGLEAGDRVKVNGVAVRSGAKACLGAFSAVLGRQVSHCVEALGSTAGLKVAEVPVSTELVLDLALSTEEVASLDLGSAQWAATSRLLFLGISTGTQASGRYSVCWARSLELSNLYSTCIGFVDIAEPSRFLSAVHPTSVKPNVDIPSILAFQTGNLDAYHESAGPMRLTVVFRDTARLRHAFQASATGALRSVPRSEASQAVCGLLFRELWAESSDGFPQPRGCYYDEELGEYGMVFSPKAGLRPGTRYQVVLMTRISYSLVSEHEWQVQAAATPIPPFSPQEILRTRPDSWGDAGVMPSDLACQEACSMSPSCNVAVWRLDSDRRCFLADLSQRSQPFATEDSLVHSNRTDVTMWMIDRLLSTTVGLANSNGTRNIGLDLWSMDDMDTRPFGVVEVSEAPIAATAAIQRLAGSQRWHETDGLMIVDSSGSTSSEDGVLQLQPEAPLLEIRLRSAFGAAIKAGALVRLFLWPLTQWSLPEESCVAECVPQSPLMSCAAPACSAFPVVTSPFRGGRNVVHLTLPEEMEPITDEVMHTLRLSGSYFPLPPGGFLPSRWAAELRPRSGGEAEAQPQADYAVSVGRLPYATVTVAGGLLSQDGVSLPFAGQADNILYLRFSLGSFLHAGSSGLAAIKFTLPAGYLCKGAGAAPSDLATLQAAAGPTAGPQARGELSAGSWNTFSGRECNFTLAPNAVVYGGSSIVVRFLVDNPGTPLSAQDTSNRWGVTVVGPGDSLAALRLPLVLLEGLHSDLLLFPPAVAVLGRVSLTSLTPSNFWWAAPRNLVRVFFRTQQSSGENSGRIQLSVPEWGGFTFQAFCSIMDLPSQYYRPVQGLYGQAATGVLQETPPTVVKLLPGARICRGITVSTAVGSRPSVAEISMTGPLQAATAYAFIIEVIPLGSAFVAQPGTGFHLSTLAQMPSVGGAAGLPLVSSLLLDRTEEPIPLIEATASDLWPSFGVYSDQAEGPPVLSALIANLLPYALTSAASAVAVLLRLPAGVDIGAPRWSTVSWRVMAPTTYVWSFPVGRLFYRQLDVPGTTADLPVIRLPLAPRIEPLNRLDFNGLDKDPLGWQVGETYGFRAGIQVPAETVRHAVNEWVVEWGFDRADLAGRALAAVAPGQEVRTLHSFQFWSVGSSIQGDGTELLFQFGTVTEVPPLVGALLIEAPAGFIFEPACVPFAPRTEYHPYLELPVGVDCVSTEGISYGAAADAGQQPLVTVRPVDGNLPPGMWSFVIACFLPTSSFGPQSFVLRSFKSLGSQVVDEIADVGATAQGLRIGQLLPFAALVSDVDYRLSSRDDHPGLASELIFAFELRALQAAAGLISLEVLAPEGFLFAESCKASIGLGIFGSGKPYLPPFVPFEPGVQIASCTGYRHLAQLQVTPGLQPGRRYAFRLRADQQPAATPVRNEWRVNFGSEASEAIPGFYLWAFSGMALDMVLTTRLLPTVENQVVIVFTPANTIRAKAGAIPDEQPADAAEEPTLGPSSAVDVAVQTDRPPAVSPAVLDSVWVSEFGEKYHRAPECRGLRSANMRISKTRCKMCG